MKPISSPTKFVFSFTNFSKDHERIQEIPPAASWNNTLSNTLGSEFLNKQHVYGAFFQKTVVSIVASCINRSMALCLYVILLTDEHLDKLLFANYVHSFCI